MALSMRVSAVRCTARPAVRAASAAPRPALRVVVVRAEPAKTAVETAIKEAEDACKDGSTAECAAAWDAVEEVSAAAADKATVAKENSDPLEQYCEGDPSADECRVYE